MALSWLRKRVYGTFAMHHWRVHAKEELPGFPPDVTTRKGESIIFHHVQAKSELNNFWWHPGQSDWGVNHLSTFNPELRNVSFPLISFMGFSAILSPLQPFQICIYKGKYSKLTFSNGYQLMRKRVYGTFACIIGDYMQKWNFQDFHQISQPRGGWSSLNFWSWTQKWRFCIHICLWGFLLY